MGINEFLSDGLQRGFSKEELSNTLIKRGYSKKEIELAYSKLSGDSVFRKENEINAYNKVIMLFSDFNTFFKNVREPTITKSLLLLLIISALTGLISIGIAYLISGFGLRGIGFSSLWGIGYGGLALGLGIFFLILMMIGSFVYAGVVHLVSKWMGGEGKYVDAYNICAYSMIPSVILRIIPFIGIISFIYSIVLTVFGISEQYKISKGKATLAALLPIIVVVAIIIIFVLFLIFSFRGFF